MLIEDDEPTCSKGPLFKTWRDVLNWLQSEGIILVRLDIVVEEPGRYSLEDFTGVMRMNTGRAGQLEQSYCEFCSADTRALGSREGPGALYNAVDPSSKEAVWSAVYRNMQKLIEDRYPGLGFGKETYGAVFINTTVNTVKIEVTETWRERADFSTDIPLD